MRQPGKEHYDQRQNENNLNFLLYTYYVVGIILKALYVLTLDFHGNSVRINAVIICTCQLEHSRVKLLSICLNRNHMNLKSELKLDWFGSRLKAGNCHLTAFGENGKESWYIS